jgi:predicted nucleic acid-binding protein
MSVGYDQSIMVDSSVWIDFMRGQRSAAIDCFRELLFQSRVLVGDLILCEVLQGLPLSQQQDAYEGIFSRNELVIIGSIEVAITAAKHFQRLRAKGVTVRKTIDMLIGSWCILYKVPLLHNDRDYDALEKYCGLKVVR